MSAKHPVSRPLNIWLGIGAIFFTIAVIGSGVIAGSGGSFEVAVFCLLGGGIFAGLWALLGAIIYNEPFWPVQKKKSDW